MRIRTYPGFTLVELLVVIAILSILSTLGVSNFMTARTKARDVSRKSDLQTIAKSLEAYVNDHRVYPSSNSDGEIICQPVTTTECPWGTIFSDGVTTYAVTLPIDPVTTSRYYYVSSGTNYTLYATLENPNDSAATTFDPAVNLCGDDLCNYKITSSNL